MPQPSRTLMVCFKTMAVTLACLLVSLPLQAETSPDALAPLPAPPLMLKTQVTVFPALQSEAPTWPSDATPLVEVPPVSEGSTVLQHLLGDSGSLEIPESQIEPALEVPVAVSEPADPIAPPPITHLSVTLDWYLNPQHATLLVAREKGMFQRRGLEVSLNTPADPKVSTKLLAAGRTDLALGRQTQLHLLADRDLPVVRVATLIAAPLSGLILFDSVEDEQALAGRRVGYTDIDGRDAMLYSAMQTLLGTAQGLALVEPVDVSYRVLNAMREQRIESALVHHRYLLPLQLADEGVTTRLLPIEELGVPPHDGLILMANRDRLNGKRDAVRQLVAALEEAALWIVEQPQAAWSLLEQNVPALADEASRQAWEKLYPRFALRPAAVDQRRYLSLEQHLFEAGRITTVKPLERLALDLGVDAH